MRYSVEAVSRSRISLWKWQAHPGWRLWPEAGRPIISHDDGSRRLRRHCVSFIRLAPA